MPFITKNGKPVWITPQRDTIYNWAKRTHENDNRIIGVRIPDYILYGKDDKKFLYSTEKENKEYEKEYRDHQKQRLQMDIIRKEILQNENAQNLWKKSWLDHHKKKEDIQIELEIQKEHGFHGRVWQKNRERKLEYQKNELKDIDDKLDKLKKELKLYKDGFYRR